MTQLNPGARSDDPDQCRLTNIPSKLRNRQVKKGHEYHASLHRCITEHLKSQRVIRVVFHACGRQTPSCCNLSFMDVEGSSEAALPTQLCGGCRRARYCSVACQKAASSDGGHSQVCVLYQHACSYDEEHSVCTSLLGSKGIRWLHDLFYAAPVLLILF